MVQYYIKKQKNNWEFAIKCIEAVMSGNDLEFDLVVVLQKANISSWSGSTFF